jgi:hypothetical protein
METNLCDRGHSTSIKLKEKRKDLQSYSHNKCIAKSAAEGEGSLNVQVLPKAG